jgi:hypothetical protein
MLSSKAYRPASVARPLSLRLACAAARPGTPSHWDTDDLNLPKAKEELQSLGVGCFSSSCASQALVALSASASFWGYAGAFMSQADTGPRYPP